MSEVQIAALTKDKKPIPVGGFLYSNRVIDGVGVLSIERRKVYVISAEINGYFDYCDATDLTKATKCGCASDWYVNEKLSLEELICNLEHAITALTSKLALAKETQKDLEAEYNGC